MATRLALRKYLTKGIVLIAVLFAGLAGIYYAQAQSTMTEHTQEPLASTLADSDPLFSERGIGDPSAPVIMQEFSSLTCSHCGDFHKKTLPKLKEKYIDTGKLYLIFRDFPLNAPAMHASMAARCLPENRYAPFIQVLFENQDHWAYGVDYLKYLRQQSQLAGLSAEQFAECLQNVKLQEAIIASIQQGKERWNISSTPTFVLNDSTLINGAASLDSFEKSIDALLVQKEAE